MRIVWGFKGSQYAQFREFWPRTSEIKKELFGLLHASPIVKMGHSAMGALMMISLVFNVILLAASGYAMGTDLFFGEEWVEQLHALLANALMVLSAIHVLAALIIGRLEGVNLIAAMINGYKRFKSD
jgi:cytochrome b